MDTRACACTLAPLATSALRAMTSDHHGVRPTQEVDIGCIAAGRRPWAVGPSSAGMEIAQMETSMLHPLLSTWASGSLLHLRVHCCPSPQRSPLSVKGRVFIGQLWPCPASCHPWASELGGNTPRAVTGSGLCSEAASILPSGPSHLVLSPVTMLLSPPFGQPSQAPRPRLRAGLQPSYLGLGKEAAG